MGIKDAHFGVVAFISLLLAGCGSGGGTKTDSTPRTATTARAVTDPNERFSASGAVEIQWEAPDDIPAEDILEYHVIRDGTWVGSTSRRQQTLKFVDTEPRPSNLTTYTRPNDSGTLITLPLLPSRYPKGETTRYQVAAIYKAGDSKYFQKFLPESNPVTCIAPPVVSAMDSRPDLNRVRVPFDTVPGADEYVIEFATNPAFNDKVTRGPFRIPATGTSASVPPLNIQREFQHLREGRIYFRVGARNSKDPLLPISRTTPNDDHFIYSDYADKASFPKP